MNNHHLILCDELAHVYFLEIILKIFFQQENAARSPLDELDENLEDDGDGLSEGEVEKFSSPMPEATPASVQEIPEKKVPKSPEPTKKSPTPPPSSKEPEVNFMLNPKS